MRNSNGDFDRHILNQHTEGESFVDDMAQLQELIEKTKQLLTEGNLYPANYMKGLENFSVIQGLECFKELNSNLRLKLT